MLAASDNVSFLRRRSVTQPFEFIYPMDNKINLLTWTEKVPACFQLQQIESKPFRLPSHRKSSLSTYVSLVFQSLDYPKIQLSTVGSSGVLKAAKGE